MKICSHIFLEEPNYTSSKRAYRALHCLRNLKRLHNGWMWFFKFSVFSLLVLLHLLYNPKFSIFIYSTMLHPLCNIFPTFHQSYIYIPHIIRICGLSKCSIWLNYLRWLKGMSILTRNMRHERHMVFFIFSLTKVIFCTECHVLHLIIRDK